MNKYNPLVSIIIPVYNGANYMKIAIDSALNQSYKNIEIIVVNDGSTDNDETEKIALSYGDKIRYYKKENGGCASALNFGISKMEGEWFSWLSHDDVYFPKKIESQINMIKNFNLDIKNTIVICENMVINNVGKKLFCHKHNGNYKKLSSQDMFKKFMNGRSLNGCSLLIPKCVLNKTGKFSTEYTYILDWIYWIDLALNGCVFFEYPEILVKNRKHIEQVSIKKQAILESETSKYTLELFDKVKDNRDYSLYLWSYCKRIGLKDACEKISQFHKIPFLLFIKGTLLRMKSVLRGILKKILHLLNQ